MKVMTAKKGYVTTVGGGYIPLLRRGGYKVQTAAVYADSGEKFRSKNFERDRGILPFFVLDSETDAVDVMNKINEGMVNKNSKDGTWVVDDNNSSTGKAKIKFVSTYVVADQIGPLQDTMSISNFVNVLDSLGINLSPEAREKVVTALSRVDDSSRSNLKRFGNPGWNADIGRSIAMHLEKSAYQSARESYGFQLDDIMADSRKWFGDWDKLARLKENMEKSRSGPGYRQAAELYLSLIHI